MKLTTIARTLIATSLLALTAQAASPDTTRWPTLGPAATLAAAPYAPILAATKAGERIVAVGDHGVILLSDDGQHFRQAKSVPFRSLLTSVQFVDSRRGFAAGHDGVVLGTTDSGDNWTLLRATPGVEKPILSLHFDNPEHGLAVGLFGWAIETSDGGRSWNERHIGKDENSDQHLFRLFTSPKGTWLIAAEAGTVMRSVDAGKTWQAVDTGNLGSFWDGLALADGTLLVCGMRGHLYRSVDDGLNWQVVESGTTQSLTSIAQLANGTVLIVGMNGVVLRSSDNGATFSSTQREQGEPLTAVMERDGNPQFFSMVGPVAPNRVSP